MELVMTVDVVMKVGAAQTKFFRSKLTGLQAVYSAAQQKHHQALEALPHAAGLHAASPRLQAYAPQQADPPMCGGCNLHRNTSVV
jgi:hypothetical protein